MDDLLKFSAAFVATLSIIIIPVFFVSLRRAQQKMFRPRPGGYLFQPFRPGIFAGTKSYIVNESQKAEIMAIMTLRPPLWQYAMFTAGSLVVIMSGIWIAIVERTPQMTAIFTISAVVLILGLFLRNHWKMNQLEPVFAGLPLSEEQIFTSIERRQWPQLGVHFCAMVLLGISLGRRPPLTDWESTALPIALGLLAYYAYCGFRRQDQGTGPSSPP